MVKEKKPMKGRPVSWPMRLVWSALALMLLIALAVLLLPTDWLVPAATIAFGIALICVVAWRLPAWLVKQDAAQTKGGDGFTERTNAVNGARASVVQGIVGVLALAGAVVAFMQWRNDREQLEDSRELSRLQMQQANTGLQQASTNLLMTSQAQVAERFTNAIEQLGSGKPELQLGGIYGLEKIARESENYRLQVFEVLTAYVRQHARQKEADSASLSSLEHLEVRQPDVQAIMTVLGRRKANPNDPPLNLRRVDLRKSDLQRAQLQRARLDGAWLEGANLNWAQLEGVRLLRARLHRTRLTLAEQLESAELEGAQSDEDTHWPPGFKVREAGVKPQED